MHRFDQAPCVRLHVRGSKTGNPTGFQLGVMTRAYSLTRARPAVPSNLLRLRKRCPCEELACSIN